MVILSDFVKENLEKCLGKKTLFIACRELLQEYQSTPRKFPLNLSAKIACFIFLFWLTSGKSYRKISTHFRVDRQSIGRIIRRFVRYTSKFSNKNISMLNIQRRRKIVLEHCRNAIMRRVTTLWDGTHVPVQVRNKTKEKVKAHISFKTKKSSYNTVLGMAPNGLWLRTSKSYPAGAHTDQTIMNLEFTDLKKELSPSDLLLADQRVFTRRMADEIGNQLISPHPGQELTPEQTEDNYLITSERVKIEQRIGNLKLKFAILTTPFRLDESLFNSVIRICCAIHNIEKQNRRFSVEELQQYDAFYENDHLSLDQHAEEVIPPPGTLASRLIPFDHSIEDDLDVSQTICLRIPLDVARRQFQQ